MFGNIPTNLIDERVQLRADIDNLLSRRLLAPALRVQIEQGEPLEAWSAFPWYSFRAQSAEGRMIRRQEDAFGRLRDFCEQVDLSSPSRQALFALLDQVLELWSRSSAALRKQLEVGFGWERAGGMVNMIPGRPGTACHPVLLVVAQGTTLNGRLRETINHCIHCHGTTRLALVVTDRWDNEQFLDQHGPTFRALHDAFGLRLGVLVRVGDGFVFQRAIE